MFPHASFGQWILGFILILSAIGVVSLRKPIYASLSFLLLLLTLATFYLQLSAEFIAVMQILVYAGAILVTFVFVIVLFQDAHQKIEIFKAQSQPQLLIIAGAAFVLIVIFFGMQFIHTKMRFPPFLPEGFGSVKNMGQSLYVDFFFPFEAVILLFLVAMIGAFYMAKKER